MTHEINDQDSVPRLTVKAWTQMHFVKTLFWQSFKLKSIYVQKKSLNTKLLWYGGKKQNKTHDVDDDDMLKVQTKVTP